MSTPQLGYKAPSARRTRYSKRDLLDVFDSCSVKNTSPDANDAKEVDGGHLDEKRILDIFTAIDFYAFKFFFDSAIDFIVSAAAQEEDGVASIEDMRSVLALYYYMRYLLSIGKSSNNLNNSNLKKNQCWLMLQSSCLINIRRINGKERKVTFL
jgi:hypothetical protein